MTYPFGLSLRRSAVRRIEPWAVAVILITGGCGGTQQAARQAPGPGPLTAAAQAGAGPSGEAATQSSPDVPSREGPRQGDSCGYKSATVSAAFGTQMPQQGGICTFGEDDETTHARLVVNPFPDASVPQKTLPELRTFEMSVVQPPAQLTDQPQWGSGSFMVTNPSAVRSIALVMIPGHTILISEPGEVDSATFGRIAASLVQALR